MSSPHFEDVKEHLRSNPQKKWGFVVYRCTYGDDEAWERMMSRLRIQSKLNLQNHDAEDLYPRIDWAVQEDPSWDGAKPAFVKEQFIAWTKSEFPNSDGGPRMFGCIMIDKQSLDTLNDERAPPEDDFDMDGRTWVWMVSSYTGERTTRVGVSYIMPRTWLLLDIRGWSAIWDDGMVVTP